MLDGVTGLKIKGRNVQELCDAMLALMDEPTRSKMGQMARSFSEANRVDEPFTAILDSDAYRLRLEEQKDPALRNPLQLKLTLLDPVLEEELYTGAIPA